jgi:CBS domain-containing protein
MNAKDIMTRDIITVSPSMSVKNLAMALIKNQISGAPVAGRKRQNRRRRFRKPISSPRAAKTSNRS